MEVIYGLIPGMILLGLVMVGVLFWAARSGQFDDLEGDAHRILMDEDLRDEGTQTGKGAEAGEAGAPASGEGGDDDPARRS
jgi:cbb3-type cytochrome oxidase maturation protein